METTLSHRELKNLAIDIRKRVAGGEQALAVLEEVENLHGTDVQVGVLEIVSFQEEDDPSLAASFVGRNTNSLAEALTHIFQMCLGVTHNAKAAESCIKSVLNTYIQQDGREETMNRYLEFLAETIFKDWGRFLGRFGSEMVATDLRRVMIGLLQVDPIKITGRWQVFDDQDFLACFHPDEFWISRVSRFINSGDFERAWDELRKANRGFFPPGFKQNNFDPRVRGAFWATGEAVKALVNDLYSEMLGHGVSLPKNVHAGRCSRWRWGRSYRQQVLVPGFDIAYFSCCQVHSDQWEITEEDGCWVTSEGRRALLLGDYFLEARNIKRRARNERQRA